MKNAHKSCEFNDNRDGTLSIRYRHAAGLSYSAVISQKPLPPGSAPSQEPHLPETEIRAMRLREHPRSQLCSRLGGTASDPSVNSPATTSLKRAMQDSPTWQYVQMWVTGGFHDAHFNDEQERIAFIQILGLPTSTLLEPPWINSFKQKLTHRAQRRFYMVLSILLRVVGVLDKDGDCRACEVGEGLRGCFVLPPLAQELEELQSVVGRRCANCILFKRGCSFAHTMSKPMEQSEHASAQLYESSPESEYASAEPEGALTSAPDPSGTQQAYEVESDDGQGVYADGSPSLNDTIPVDPHLPVIDLTLSRTFSPQRNPNPHSAGLGIATARPNSQASYDQNIPSPPTTITPRLAQNAQMLPPSQTSPSRRHSSETTLTRFNSIKGKEPEHIFVDADELYSPLERQDLVTPRHNHDDVSAHAKTISVDVINLIQRVEKTMDKDAQANFVGRMLWLLSLDGQASAAFDTAAALSERGLGLTGETMPNTHIKPANTGSTPSLGMIVLVLLDANDLEREAGNIVASILRLPEARQDATRKMVQVLCTTLLQTPVTPWNPTVRRASSSSQEKCISFHRQLSTTNEWVETQKLVPRTSLNNDYDMFTFPLSKTRHVDILCIRERTWIRLRSPSNGPSERVCRVLSGRLQVCRQDDMERSQIVMDRGQMFHISSGVDCLVRSVHTASSTLEIDYSI